MENGLENKPKGTVQKVTREKYARELYVTKKKIYAQAQTAYATIKVMQYIR